MSAAELLLTACGLLFVAASLSDRKPLMRGGTAAAALCAFFAWRGSGLSLVLGLLALLLAAVNLFHLATLLLAGRRLRFTEEEQGMLAHGLTGLDRAQARHLLDQGMWIDGKAGEVLTRENQPVTHLFFLADGSAEVTSRGMWIATTRAPTFLGEITVLDETGATATVTLDNASRFWCVPADKLRTFLRENPAIRVALENSFVGALADKLRLSNKAIMAAGVTEPA